jgi:FixJ family two-component response regulator
MAMPGMSGEQLAATLKALSPMLPIMLLTGFGAFLDPANASVVDVVANKPITLEDLRRSIDTAMHSPVSLFK